MSDRFGEGRLTLESDALHARVRAFAQGPGETFETLALDIARFQRDWSAGYRRLVDARGSQLDTLQSIPPVPSEAFRLARVAIHPPKLDVARFRTSGTTGAETGIHPVRTLETYDTLSLQLGKAAFFSRTQDKRVIVALAPRPEADAKPVSSLSYMMQLFIERFDGRSLSETRWLLRAEGPDVAGLERAAAVARELGEPLVVLGTAFAFVALLDALGARKIRTLEGSLVMYTGGFKGRTREVELGALIHQISTAFGLAESRVIGEYGMTELTSQLYERPTDERRGIYVAPPWLRVIPSDPVTLNPVAAGDVGVALFVDLGNVDSAVAVVTQDLVRQTPDGIELLGRRPGAPARGCSLAVEGLLATRG